MAVDEEIAALDLLSTEELRHRAFDLAKERRDLAFFWSIFTHLPHADDTEALDASLGSIGAGIGDVAALWREFTGHGYGEAEPLLRAAFIDYLVKDPSAPGGGRAYRRDNPDDPID